MATATALVKTDGAQSGHTELQLVTFRIDSEEYGVEVLKVREIIRMPTITHMPNTPHYVDGIINLRGKVIPIVSMRRRFGMMDENYNSHTRIIIMDVNGSLTGFVVDAVAEVVRIPSGEIQPPPSLSTGQIDQESITGVFNHHDRMLIVMDIERMFSAEQYSN
jgi:purine-binding chemotaxis protein CheW